jgi:rhamnogalacturonan endolyase
LRQLFRWRPGNRQGFDRRHDPLGFERLESRHLLAFGLTTSTNSYTVDTGANVVFAINRTTALGGSVGDLQSMKYNGTELEAPFSATSRYSHYESGLSSSTVVSATVDPQGNWIKITCDDTSGTGVIQYYIARKGFNNIYMATYAAGPNSPSPGEMRFITYTNHSVLTNAPAPSNNTGSTKTVESMDVFGFADGTTSSKYYGEYRAIDATTYGLTGGGFGVFMNIGNRETSSGGPFFKDIDFQTTSSQSTELYTYVFSGHSQTENFRPGLHGPYALQFTTGGQPASIDYSFIDGLGLTGYVGATGRGTLSGTASGVPAGLQATVALSNATAQYWGTPDAATGAYTIPGILPGTYTETLYQGELAIGTVNVTISAGATTKQNITNTLRYQLLSSSSSATSTPVINAPIFRIGTWDGTPLGFLNADKITIMHPTDSRMSAWSDSSGVTNFTVGTDPDSAWPMAEWHTQNSAAPWVDTDNRITFNLTAAQAATPLTLRIGLTRLDHGRPNISVNGVSSSTQSIASEPDSRGLTVGNWRGNNALYSFNISTSSLHAGTNTIDISCVSGSTGTLYSGYHIYDAIDLVPTSSLTNAPVLTSIAVSPNNSTVTIDAQTTFTATARDQFGNVMPANFTWSATSGTIDGTGMYTAPGTTGSPTVTATSGSISGNTTVNVTYLKGDLNFDGQRTAADLSALLQALCDLASFQNNNHLSNAAMLAIADTDNDQQVTDADIQGELNLLISGSSPAPTASAPPASSSAVAAPAVSAITTFGVSDSSSATPLDGEESVAPVVINALTHSGASNADGVSNFIAGNSAAVLAADIEAGGLNFMKVDSWKDMHTDAAEPRAKPQGVAGDQVLGRAPFSQRDGLFEQYGRLPNVVDGHMARRARGDHTAEIMDGLLPANGWEEP